MSSKINLTSEQLELVKELAKKGETKVNIATAVGCSRTVIYRILKEFDIQLAESNRNKKGSKKTWTIEQENKLKELYGSEEYSLIDIAVYFNTSLKTITNKGKELNLVKKRALEITKGDVEYYQNNIETKSISEMAKERRLDEYGVTKKLQLLGLKEGAVKYKNRKMPEGEEFWKDYINPRLTNAEIGDKWNLNSKTVGKWRRQDFGKNFRTKVNRFISMSSPERKIAKILDELNMTYFFQENIEDERVDFYLGFNLIVEVNGRYYHSLDRAIKKDKEKLSKLQKAVYCVIVICDDELDNINAIKKNILTHYSKAIQAQVDAVLG